MLYVGGHTLSSKIWFFRIEDKDMQQYPIAAVLGWSKQLVVRNGLQCEMGSESLETLNDSR